MKLRKSRENVLVSGVLGGLGEYFNMDPTIIRIVFVVMVFLDFSPLIPLYIIGAILIPKASPLNKKEKEDTIIDNHPIDTHNINDVSEINEEDWSDF